MKRLLIFSVLITIFCTTKSQTKALTENGKEVLLYEDGTWKYSSSDGDSLNDFKSIQTNPTEFHKSVAETFPVKSNIAKVAVYIDPGKWTFIPHKPNEVIPEYRFEMKSSQGYAMLITEKIQIDLENLKNIALENAIKGAPDAKITHSEFRMVNGKKVLCLTIKGTIKGIKFTYLGYYFSDANGTTQFLAFGSDNMYKDYLKEWEIFLNGFTVLN